MSSRTYGIDVHGTLAMRTGEVSGIAPSTLFPLLQPLMQAWMRQGQRVFIVSGPPKAWIERELAVLGLDRNVHYHRVVSMVDELPLLFPDADIWPDPKKEGHFWTDEETWVRIKGKICDKYGIDILVDDTEAYGRHLPPMTSFVHVKASLLDAPRPEIDRTDRDRIERMEGALRWYMDEAKAIHRHMAKTPPRPEACLASLTVLSLDDGQRGQLAMDQKVGPSQGPSSS